MVYNGAAFCFAAVTSWHSVTNDLEVFNAQLSIRITLHVADTAPLGLYDQGEVQSYLKPASQQGQ
jgi:hypothetical protein